MNTVSLVKLAESTHCAGRATLGQRTADYALQRNGRHGLAYLRMLIADRDRYGRGALLNDVR